MVGKWRCCVDAWGQVEYLKRLSCVTLSIVLSFIVLFL